MYASIYTIITVLLSKLVQFIITFSNRQSRCLLSLTIKIIIILNRCKFLIDQNILLFYISVIIKIW